MSKKLTYISLFSCAGVGCYGFKQQGFECVATNEFYPKRLAVQKANMKCKYQTGYIEGDITLDKTKQAILNEIDYWKEHENLDSVDVLIATPPCQGMSVANRYKKNETPRNSLIIESLQIIEKVFPKFFIFENVRSFLKTPCMDSDGQTRKIGDAISLHLAKDYHISSKILNFQNYGSNSSRTRTLVFGIRKDIPEKYSIENPSIELFLPKLQNPKTLRDCIGHLPRISGGDWFENDLFHFSKPLSKNHLYWIEKVKEGQSAFDQEDVSRRPDVKKGFKDKYTRVAWDKTAGCVHTNFFNLSSQHTGHPCDNRTFSMREAMIFQTIPLDFKWFDGEITKEKVLKNMSNIRECVGESVPTRIFEQIAAQIQNLI